MSKTKEEIKTEIFNELKTIIIDRLGVEENEVTPDKTLKDLSADSLDRKSTRLNSSHLKLSRMPSSA